MSSLLKVGAKNPSGVAAPISCDANGNLITQRKWNASVTKVYDDVINTTGTKKTTRLDLTDAGLVSIRVHNASRKALNIIFYGDDGEHENSGLRDVNGELISVTVSETNPTYCIITPNEVPMLNYMASLKMGLSIAESSDATNNTAVYVVVKK